MAAVLGYGSLAQLKDVSTKRNVRRNDNKNNKKNGFRVSCVYSSAVSDPYKTLKITPSASESEVKKAFRQLALKYHPDVCRGNNCDTIFHQIYEAYDVVINNLRGEPIRMETKTNDDYYDENEPLRGMNEEDYDMWEEWMGWEGAGIRDYSSHINPYI